MKRAVVDGTREIGLGIALFGCGESVGIENFNMNILGEDGKNPQLTRA